MKILITGASSGIGEAFAKYYGERKNDLFLVARSIDKLIEMKIEFESKFGIKVETLKCDLNIAEDVDKLLKVDLIKSIDYLINNAGFSTYGPYVKNDSEKELELINVNIVAMERLFKGYCREFAKRDRGIILNTGSTAGFFPGPFMSNYYASKAYVVNLTIAVKEELRLNNSNVKISVLCPGTINTNFEKTAKTSLPFKIGRMPVETLVAYTDKRVMRGKTILIPTLLMKVVIHTCKFLPKFLVLRIVSRMQKNTGI